MAELFLRNHPELQSFLLHNVQQTGTIIGAGAYGSVEEVVVSGAICAAKRIHDFFLNPTQVPNAAIQEASTQFVKECQLVSTLRHPNIVQFLGVCFSPGSRLPTLVMERLSMSLHDLLDPETHLPPPPEAPKPYFPLALKVSILHDVACGLAYLHERPEPIIHRDLSARNVLVNSSMVAKIADLGVARIVPHSQRTRLTMTKGPGAIIYMPPEAMEENQREARHEKSIAKYGANIDIFSLGVVAIFTLCQTFPCSLLAPTYRKGMQLKGRTELERREVYMNMIQEQLPKKHPLLRMIEGCLNFPDLRPKISHVLTLLEEARACTVRDEQIDMNRLQLIRAIQNQPTKQPSENQDEVARLEADIRDMYEFKEELQQMLEYQKGTSELDDQLSFKEVELSRAREAIRSRDRELAMTKQHLKQKEEQLRSCEAELAQLRSSTSPKPKWRVQCEEKKSAPAIKWRRSATTYGPFAYFTPLNYSVVYQLHYHTGNWEKFNAPYQNSGLATIHDKVTTLGGQDGSRLMNKLMTHCGGQWVEECAPMYSPHFDSAIVSTPDGTYMFVIGGRMGAGWTVTVEVYQVKTNQWFKTTPMPEPLPGPSATICGSQLSLIGVGGTAYSCSLHDLPSSNEPLTSPVTLSWMPLPPPPVTGSTVAHLSGRLLLIGGRKGNGPPVKSIYQLLEEEKGWEEVGSMNFARSECVVVNRSLDRVIIVGGGSHATEECTAVVMP